MEIEKNNMINLEKRFGYLKSIIFNENDLLCKGAKFQIIIFEPNSHLKPHYHEKTTEMFYILRGNCILRLDHVELKCKPGSVFLCKARVIHEFINESSEKVEILNFKVNEIAGDIVWGDEKLPE